MITYHEDLMQGSDEWHAIRCGLLTASEMKLIITPTLKPAANDKERAHLYELLAQRVTNYVEPRYVSDDMMRGNEDEIEARLLYAKHHAPVEDTGFVTNDAWGFEIGYSPDGLVGIDGLIECKSRRQKFQAETIICGEMPEEYSIQVQTGLLVTGRKWCDFVSYSGGMPIFVKRILPNEKIMNAIVDAALNFELRLLKKLETYRAKSAALVPTERRIEQEMHL
jgi:hypothetical protein